MSAYNHNYLKFICNLMWKMISRMVELENKRQSARLTFSNLLLKQFFGKLKRSMCSKSEVYLTWEADCLETYLSLHWYYCKIHRKKNLYILNSNFMMMLDLNIIQNDIYLLGEEASFIPDKPKSNKEWNGTRKTILKKWFVELQIHAYLLWFQRTCESAVL